MKFSAKIEGADVLIGALENKMKVKERVRQVIRTNGGQMQESTQRFAPVDTGHLKRSVSLNYEDEDLTAIVESKALNGYGDNYSVYQEWGTRYQPGTPHVGPAFHKQVPVFKADIKKVVKG